MQRNRTISLLLQVGLAITLVYAAVAGFFEPNNWIGFLPNFLRDLVPVSDKLLLTLVGSAQIIVSIPLVVQKKPFYPAIAAAIFFGAVVVLNFGALDIVFRDIGLFFAAVALAVHSKRRY